MCIFLAIIFLINKFKKEIIKENNNDESNIGKSFLEIIQKNVERFKNSYVLTIFFFFINFLNMDFHARFTAYLFIFFVMSLCNVYKVSLRRTKFLILGPYIVVVFVWLGFFYYQVFSLRNSVYINGNFDVYKTIFDSHSFP